MRFSPFQGIKRILCGCWRALDWSRRLLFNLIFLLVLVMLVAGLFSGGSKKLEEKTALVLNFKGQIVEQHPGGSAQNLLLEAGAERNKTIQLRDVLDVLDKASRDAHIQRAVLILDDLNGVGLAQLREIAQAMERFKARGKSIIAWGSGFDQRQYLLAAHANEVYLHPMGSVILTGFGRYQTYYKDALDKLGITVNLIRVGTYKSFAEPFIGNGPSPAAQEADRALLGSLWQVYLDDVEKSRKLPAGSIMDLIDHLPARLEAAGGDMARLAVENKLVDGLKTRDELRTMMVQLGAADEKSKSFRQISFDEYLAQNKAHLPSTQPGVGVVVASGNIVDGSAPAGVVGGISTANLIRKAREDDSIKAVVLRVDSPGGSAFASELIRRELELTRKAGKPVVVSMGNVAASGGYWISMAADQVIADPATVTGSIGVFALLPTAEKAAEKIGVHSAGTTTTWLAEPYSPMRPLDPRVRDIIQSSINHIYQEFTSKAALARKTTPEKIDAVAQGRVWSGSQALERGLIDRLGNYTDALEAATTLAKLAKDAPVRYLEADLSPFMRVLSMLDQSRSSMIQDLRQSLLHSVLPLPATAMQQAEQELDWLRAVQPQTAGYLPLTHCMCRLP